ncbi:hypothetical protein CR513_26670, partial [Mucuna pruriens]
MGKAPSLGVFFWFFSIRRAKKVGWTSLSNRPKLSYKLFKNRFFRVTLGDVGPNLLVHNAGKPFFPLYWTQQPIVSISVGKDNLEEWENEFVEELGDVPTLSSVDLIKGTGLSGQALRGLKKKWAQLTTSNDVVSTALAPPLSTAHPKGASQPSAGDASQSLPVVALDSPVHVDSKPDVSEKRVAEDDGRGSRAS